MSLSAEQWKGNLVDHHYDPEDNQFADTFEDVQIREPVRCKITRNDVDSTNKFHIRRMKEQGVTPTNKARYKAGEVGDIIIVSSATHKVSSLTRITYLSHSLDHNNSSQKVTITLQFGNWFSDCEVLQLENCGAKSV